MKLLTIGRLPESHVFIDDPTVSRRHAELIVTQSGDYYLSDCASTSGTYVSGQSGWSPVRQAFVHLNDRVKFGSVETDIQHLLSL